MDKNPCIANSPAKDLQLGIANPATGCVLGRTVRLPCDVLPYLARPGPGLRSP